MSLAVNHFPAAVVGQTLRIDGVHSREIAGGIQLAEKSGLTIARLSEIEDLGVGHWPSGQPAQILRAAQVEYGTGWLDAFGPAPLVLLIGPGAGCGCGGPKRSGPTGDDLALLAAALDDELPI